MINNKQYYTFDDLLLVPQFSDIESRSEVDLSQNFLGLNLQIPILSAAMDTITGSSMAIAVNKAGGLGIPHRFFNNEQERANALYNIWGYTDTLAFSVGVKNIFDEMEILDSYKSSGNLPIVNIDVAHGDHISVVKAIKFVKESYPRVKVLAGNVSTRSGYYRLADAGADGIKVGIGGSSICTTRIVTGHGVPTLASIMDCYDARLEYSNTRMIADGGIENSGQIVKALAAGADAVMLGTLLSGTDETPGRKVEINGEIYKEFRGQSTVGSNQSTYAPEGVRGYTKAKGPVADVLKLLAGGIRSGLSYSGARNLAELRETAEFIQVSKAAAEESKARLEVIDNFELVPV